MQIHNWLPAFWSPFPAVAAWCRVQAGLAAAVMILCHAQVAAANADLGAALKRCSSVTSEKVRLVCYDKLAALQSGSPTAPQAGNRPIGDVRPTNEVNPAPAPSSVQQDTMVAQEREAVSHKRSFRFEVGAGYGHGLYSGTVDFKIDGKPVELKSQAATGGIGVAAMAGVWADNWAGDRVSLGLQYWRIGQRAEAKASLPAGIDILADPVSGRSKATLDAHVGFVNVAALLGGGHGITYVVGAGAGVAWANVKFKATANTALLPTPLSVNESTNFVAPTGQAFAGAIFDVAPPFYLSTMTHFLGGTGRPFGQPHEFYDLFVTAVAGVRF